jgi:hypothetical protein
MIRANLGKFGMIAASVLIALAGHLNAFPWLPWWAQHSIELGGFVAGIVMATSINPSAQFGGRRAGDPEGTGTIDPKRFVPIVLLAIALGSWLSLSACAGTRHPQLSSVGQTLSPALDAVGIAEKASQSLIHQVDLGVLHAADVAPAIRALGQVGQVAHDLGVLFQTYLAAVDEVGRLKAQGDLVAKLSEFNRFVQGLPRSQIEQAVADLQKKGKELQQAIAKLKG